MDNEPRLVASSLDSDPVLRSHKATRWTEFTTRPGIYKPDAFYSAAYTKAANSSPGYGIPYDHFPVIAG